jgi:D-3-phosphoglycerate dehydrogenase
VRILLAEPIAQEGVARLRAVHEVDERAGIGPDELCAILPGYDALVVRSQVQVDAAVIAAAGSRLQVIGRAGVGVDNVDLDAATAAGITVVNAPTGNTIAAAEHTLALLYGVARRIAAADASVRRGEWKRSQFTGLELRGRTLGIVGLGKIGQAIAARAVAMEMVVLASDPYVTAEQAAHHGVELVAFDALVERADVITVHVPLTRQTRGLIGRDQISRMKPGAIVLNVARGGILDEAAVADALRDGRLGGAGIDVFDSEPPTGSPLLDAPNTLLTPHLGASTAEAQILVAEEVADQVLDVLAGRSARYAVNAPLLTPETARAIAPYLPLAEMLGRFFAQFARSGVRTLTLEIAGDLAAFDASPLTAAVLRGMIETSTDQRVNLVNAAALAKARGITVVERKTPDAGSYAAQITLSGESGGRATTVAGTVAGGELRLTRLDDYRLDLEPTEVMLITNHRDRPGMIGRIGQTLGEADVNISAMHVGRSAPRADALMILALDDDVAPDVAEAIRNHDSVIDLWTIRLGPER